MTNNQTARFWPAEWEMHHGTILSFPSKQGISFPGSYEKVLPQYLRLIEILCEVEKVYLNVHSLDEQRWIENHLSANGRKHCLIQVCPTNEPWARDHGPIFVQEGKRLILTNWLFNAWGEKYKPFDLDNQVPAYYAELFNLAEDRIDRVLEGGSIEGNGNNVVMTTRSCLLNKNRNPSLSKEDIEALLEEKLGAKEFLWLGDGIEGDDTDGHIDDLARFTSTNTIVTMIEENEKDANHLPLKKNLALLHEFAKNNRFDVITLPMPPKMVREELRLPASYANFYFANDILLVPTFQASKTDAQALSILKELVPNRTVVGLDCSEIIWGLGAIHCLTQQIPAFSKV